MGKGITVIGPASTSPPPTPATPEATAFEYFTGRVSGGVFTPRPPIERWRPDLQERFEAELRRLEGLAARHEAITAQDP
jgi:hypothetical protein